MVHSYTPKQDAADGPPRAARAGAQPVLPRVVARRAARRLPGPDRPRHRLHRASRPSRGLSTDAPTCSGSACTPSRRGQAADPVRLAAAHQRRGVRPVRCSSTPPNRRSTTPTPAARWPSRSTAQRLAATLFSGPVTCQLIPPDFPAYKPYCPFTVGADDDGKWTGPDLATAQDLVAKSGTRGAPSSWSAPSDLPAARPGRRRGRPSTPRLPRIAAGLPAKPTSSTRPSSSPTASTPAHRAGAPTTRPPRSTWCPLPHAGAWACSTSRHCDAGLDGR